MGEYIGARYTTKIYENSQDPGSCEWESGVIYEPLTIVSYQNSSYVSRKAVPASAGAPTVATRYWAQTGFYNGQIADLYSKIADLKIIADTPEDFGAAGDGSTDDTTALTNLLNSSYVVYLPNRYKFTQIVIDSPHIIIGGKLISESDNSILVTSDNVAFSGVSFDLGSEDDQATTGIFASGDNVSFDNCSFKFTCAYRGIEFNFCDVAAVRDSVFETAGNAVYFKNANGECSNNVVDQTSYVAGRTDHVFDVEITDSTTVLKVNICNNKIYAKFTGVQITSFLPNTVADAAGCFIENNLMHITGLSGAVAIKFDGVKNGSARFNRILSSPIGISAVGGEVSTGDFIIEGNIFDAITACFYIGISTRNGTVIDFGEKIFRNNKVTMKSGSVMFYSSDGFPGRTAAEKIHVVFEDNLITAENENVTMNMGGNVKMPYVDITFIGNTIKGIGSVYMLTDGRLIMKNNLIDSSAVSNPYTLRAGGETASIYYNNLFYKQTPTVVNNTNILYDICNAVNDIPGDIYTWSGGAATVLMKTEITKTT